MADYLTTDTELTSVANAIRTKGGTSASLVYPTGFVSAIEAISTGTDVSDTTAVEGDVLAGKYFHKADGSKVQGTIATKTSSDLSASGKTVTVPAGYYAQQYTKDVPTGSATTPATTITANPTISVSSSGLITATASATQSVTPTVSAGYVSSGTAGTITVSGSNTSQLTTQAAQTIHPSTTDQTIASGKYLTGTQTVKGVLLTNLDAGNIKKDVVVKVGDSTDDDCVTSVTGTYEGSGGGNPEAEDNDVIFIDYDGTIRYSYSASEFANLSAMPANPTHQGLTAQGWNWSLSDAKTFVSTYGMLVIGQMYITDDEKTRVYIRISNDIRTISVQFISNVIVDWGDGVQETLSAGSVTHTYSSNGDYVVVFEKDGTGSMSMPTFENTISKGERNYIKKVELGKISGLRSFNMNYRGLRTMTFPNTITSFDVLTYMYSLKAIIIPSSITSLAYPAIDYNASLEYVSFPKLTSSTALTARDCNSLKKLTIPYNLTSDRENLCRNNYAITNVVIPNNLTGIGQYWFYYCYSLQTLTVPANVSSISNYAFTYCEAMNSIHIKNTVPPTLSNKNAFNNTTCKIYVPSASLSTYQTANNWSNYSSRMVGE